MMVCDARLLIRVAIADGTSPSHHLVPNGTSIETLVAVEGLGGRSRTVLRPPRTKFGLDHNESRSWHGWLAMYPCDAAFAMMAAIDIRPIPAPKNKTPPPAKAKTTTRLIQSVGRSRKFAASPSDRPKAYPTRTCHRMVIGEAHQAAAQRAHFKSKQL